MATSAANTIDTTVTASCAPISILRASMMSVSAPAGRVRRNIGRVVAIWTAETIIGSGLRLVISQFDDMSNIANPTFDAELATSITVNARLLKTPHGTSPRAGASELMLESLDKRTSSEEQAPQGRCAPKPQGQMANIGGSFKAPRVPAAEV